MTALASRLVLIQTDKPESVHNKLGPKLAGAIRAGLVAYADLVADLPSFSGLSSGSTLVYTPIWPMAAAGESFLSSLKHQVAQLGASLTVTPSQLLVAKSTPSQSIRESVTDATLLYWGRGTITDQQVKRLGVLHKGQASELIYRIDDSDGPVVAVQFWDGLGSFRAACPVVKSLLSAAGVAQPAMLPLGVPRVGGYSLPAEPMNYTFWS